MFLPLFILFSCSVERDMEQAKQALYEHDVAFLQSGITEVYLKKIHSIYLLWKDSVGCIISLEKPNQQIVSSRDVLSSKRKMQSVYEGKVSVALSKGKNIIAHTHLEKALSPISRQSKVESSYALLILTEGNIFEAEERYLSLSRRFPNRAEYMLGLGEVLFSKR